MNYGALRPAHLVSSAEVVSFPLAKVFSFPLPGGRWGWGCKRQRHSTPTLIPLTLPLPGGEEDRWCILAPLAAEGGGEG